MNKVNNSIGWADYSSNPVKGKCPMACDYCYARRLYDRFHWNPEIRLHIEAFEPLCDVDTPSRVFVGSTMELFGPWVKPRWLKAIFDNCRFFKKHTFIFLTKRPADMSQWSPFPENCWIGVSLTHQRQYGVGVSIAMENIKATVKFISAEPLLGELSGAVPWWCNWLIIGACTGTIKEISHVCDKYPQLTPMSGRRWTAQPKVEWLKEIVQAADKAGVPVFLKDNLKPLLVAVQDGQEYAPLWANGGTGTLRQEFPNA